jgi:plasmid stabilization system protein ParE
MSFDEIVEEVPKLTHRHPKRGEIRTVVESPIIIYYTVSASQIEILRFWHSARNPRSIRYR